MIKICIFFFHFNNSHQSVLIQLQTKANRIITIKMSDTAVVLNDDELCPRTDRQTPVIKLHNIKVTFYATFYATLMIFSSLLCFRRNQKFSRPICLGFSSLSFFLQTLLYFQCQCLLWNPVALFWSLSRNTHIRFSEKPWQLGNFLFLNQLRFRSYLFVSYS